MCFLASCTEYKCYKVLMFLLAERSSSISIEWAHTIPFLCNCISCSRRWAWILQVEEERDALLKRLSQLETDTTTAKANLEESTAKLQEWNEQKEKVPTTTNVFHFVMWSPDLWLHEAEHTLVIGILVNFSNNKLVLCADLLLRSSAQIFWLSVESVEFNGVEFFQHGIWINSRIIWYKQRYNLRLNHAPKYWCTLVMAWLNSANVYTGGDNYFLMSNDLH